ncbi:CCA tRNA nucleotidyltransferase, partial [candidate division TA06 bacterium]|nr:CCA tRNA nucleotidyltransferase [candidate division TA06 bacterium]
MPTETAHILPKDVLSLLQRVAPLLSEVTEPHLVGGLLRDTLLGRATRDLDIIFQEDALPVARRVADALGGALVVLDESRRIARVVLEDGDRTWHLDLASLQGDLHQDLARRDFTIDAMAVPLPRLLAGDWQDVLLDPFNGRQDLERHLIRAVSPTIFQEDGARLLRAVRLAALLRFALEEQTRDLIRRDAAALDTVSAERTRDELLGILAIPNAMESVYLMDDLGLLCRMLPELEEGREVLQPKEHYWDVFRHNIETVGAMEGLVDRTWDPPWVLDE